ncbi:MAG TPA: hypothetical protein VGO67_21910 [Verrucomicrobiae bacterium]|jgi:hypothetical protein
MDEKLVEMLFWLAECLPDRIVEKAVQYVDFLLSRVGAENEAEDV